MRQAWPAHPEVPISKAVRAGDFVFTSAYGPWTFDPVKVVFDDAGDIVDDGSGCVDMPFEEQVHRTVGYIEAALTAAGCTLRDVVKCECWLADARDFAAFNANLPRLLHTGSPGALGLPCAIHVRLQNRNAGRRLPPGQRRIATMATRVTQVVTFAAEPFRGNPAFVVSLERDTPSELLQAVAAQLGDGVVAVLGPQDGDAIRLRFVTATGPHPGAGHAAAAAAAVLLEGRSSVDVAFEDGTRRRFWRDDEHVVVPWPPMPFAACALGPTLGAALGRVPELCLAAEFGYVARLFGGGCATRYGARHGGLGRARSECSDRYGPWYRLGHRGARLRPQGGTARGSGLRHRPSHSLALLVRAPRPQTPAQPPSVAAWRRSLVRVRRHNGHDRRPDLPLSGRGVVTPRRIVVSWVDLVLLLTS